jgi:hypothetical protein
MGLSLQAASFQQPEGVPENAAVFTSLHFRDGKLPRSLKACFRRIFAGLGLKVLKKADFCTWISGAGSLQIGYLPKEKVQDSSNWNNSAPW